jgi:hypothetical protein
MRQERFVTKGLARVGGLGLGNPPNMAVTALTIFLGKKVRVVVLDFY